jgi:hypothetical protein
MIMTIAANPPLPKKKQKQRILAASLKKKNRIEETKRITRKTKSTPPNVVATIPAVAW